MPASRPIGGRDPIRPAGAGTFPPMGRLVALLVVLALAAFASGCDDDDSASDPANLEGIPWVLSSGVTAGGWQTIAPSAFFEDGRMSGSTGCNRYTTGYTLDGDALTIEQVAQTQIACAPRAEAVQAEFLAALAKAAAWTSDGTALSLLDSDGNEVLGFTVASPVGAWRATSFLQGDAVSGAIAGTDITATFDADGNLSGSAGCNNYTATFTTDKSAITITQPASTKKACVDPEGVMEQESDYLAALPKAKSFRVEGGTLELLTETGTFVATYAKPRTTATSGR